MSNIVFDLTFDMAPQAPALRPPRGLLDPGFLEAHAFDLRAAAGIVLLAALWVALRLCRPRAVSRPDPAEAARRTLRELRGRAEDAGTAGAAAGAVRRCAADLFGTPGAEWTTEELAQSLRGAGGAARRELAGDLESFLQPCDAVRFAARAAPVPGGVLDRAAALVERCASVARGGGDR